MILQSLTDLYQRLASDPELAMPPMGWSYEPISYALVLNRKGELVDEAMNCRDTSGDKSKPKRIIVPKNESRSREIKPYFLWDKSQYLLGVVGIDDKGNASTDGQVKITSQHYEAFRSLHLDMLADTKDEGLIAVRRFLSCWEPRHFEGHPLLERHLLGANIVFRLDGDRSERPIQT